MVDVFVCFDNTYVQHDFNVRWWRCWLRVTRLVPLVGNRNCSSFPEHMSSLPVFSGVRVDLSLVFRVVLCRTLLVFCPISFGHCIVCPSIHPLVSSTLSIHYSIYLTKANLFVCMKNLYQNIRWNKWDYFHLLMWPYETCFAELHVSVALNKTANILKQDATN